MKIKTIKNIKQIDNKRIILRVDFNVPFDKDNKITDNTRIKKTLKTINYLLKKNTKLIIITHIGRPNKSFDKNLSTKLLISELKRLTNKNVILGNKRLKIAIKQSKKLKTQEILLCENIRFYKGEEKNSTKLAKIIKNLGEIFVNEAFSMSHRNHCSVSKITEFLPSYAGFNLIQEIKKLNKLKNQKINRPYTIIIGGAKIDTKIDLLNNFINIVDNIVIGGAIANTFLKSQNINIGKSLFEKEKVINAKKILERYKKSKSKLILPTDYKTSVKIDTNSTTIEKEKNNVSKDDIIVDIGSKTIKKYKAIIRNSKTIFFNGPMGIYEIENFSKGSNEILKEIANAKNKITIIGGGDSIDALNKLKINTKNIYHISTGGGASIEYLYKENFESFKNLGG